jgi:hypothetical protein
MQDFECAPYPLEMEHPPSFKKQFDDLFQALSSRILEVNLILLFLEESVC